MLWFLVPGVILFIAGGAAIGLCLTKIRDTSAQLSALNAQVDNLQASVHALSSGARGLSDKTACNESYLKQVAARLEGIDREVPSTQLYGRAIGLASHGTNAEEIVDATGVTIGEAELLVSYRKSLQSKVG